MKLIKFIIIYLLFFTSFIAIRLSYLEAETLSSYAVAIGGVTNLFLSLLMLKDLLVFDNEDSIGTDID